MNEPIKIRTFSWGKGWYRKWIKACLISSVCEWQYNVSLGKNHSTVVKSALKADCLSSNSGSTFFCLKLGKAFLCLFLYL